MPFLPQPSPFARAWDRHQETQECASDGWVRNEDEEGQTGVVWTCHEERPRVCRKKDDGNGVPGKRKRGRPKMFRCSERRYGRS